MSLFMNPSCGCRDEVLNLWVAMMKEGKSSKRGNIEDGAHEGDGKDNDRQHDLDDGCLRGACFNLK